MVEQAVTTNLEEWARSSERRTLKAHRSIQPRLMGFTHKHHNTVVLPFIPPFDISETCLPPETDRNNDRIT
jgi:hypothetical protein